MTRKCVVCKVEGFPGCDRSFHCFPKDESMRRQWIESLKLKSEINFKTNFVCSIHFNEKCFTDRIGQRQRLLAGSVPVLEFNKIQTVALDINKDEAHVQTILESTSCLESNCNEYRGEISNIDESIDDNISTANIENEESPCKNVSNTIVICDTANSNQRKNSFDVNSVVKRVKFTHCNQVKSLSRSDFVSDKGWEKCLQFKKYFLLKLNAAQSRICRKDKKVQTLTALITHLQKQEECVNYNKKILKNSNISEKNYCKPLDHDYWYIIRHLKRIIHCDKCLSIIDSSKSNTDSTLIMLKNKGALNFACDSLIIICKCTERLIRESPNLFAKDICMKIINGPMRSLPSHLFNDDHFFEQEPLMDHRNQLIMLVIKTYINIRLCHESCLINDNTNRIRMKNNKITIFSGQ